MFIWIFIFPQHDDYPLQSCSTSHVLTCAENSMWQVLRLLDLCLEPDRINHSSSPQKWPVLLQYFKLSVVNPMQFYAFNLLLFPAISLQTHCEISWALNFYIHAALILYVSLEQTAFSIISTIVVMLMVHWFICQMLGNLLSNPINPIIHECKRNFLGNGTFLYQLSTPLCMFLRVCVAWSLISVLFFLMHFANSTIVFPPV